MAGHPTSILLLTMPCNTSQALMYYAPVRPWYRITCQTVWVIGPPGRASRYSSVTQVTWWDYSSEIAPLTNLHYQIGHHSALKNHQAQCHPKIMVLLGHLLIGGQSHCMQLTIWTCYCKIWLVRTTHRGQRPYHWSDVSLVNWKEEIFMWGLSESREAIQPPPVDCQGPADVFMHLIRTADSYKLLVWKASISGGWLDWETVDTRHQWTCYPSCPRNMDYVLLSQGNPTAPYSWVLLTTAKGRL